MRILKYFFLEFLILIHRIPLNIFFHAVNRKDHVLIVKIDAIGDAIIWLDTAKEYRNIYPGKKLVLLYNKAWEDLALKLPYFDQFIPFDQKKFWKSILYRFQLLSTLNKYYFETVVNPTYARNYFIQDWLIHNIKAKEKIGSTGDYNNTNNTIAKLTTKFSTYNPRLKKTGDSWYTKIVPANTAIKEMMLVRNAEFIRNCYDLPFLSQLPIFPFPIENIELLDNKKYCVIFMGGSTERRMWDIEKFADIINYINNDYSIVLCGGKYETSLFEQLNSSNLLKRSVIDLIGQTTLPELIGVIKGAEFIITNETSASHITVATRTPSICILGGGHYGMFQPYQVEKISEEEKKYLPVIVSLNMECFNCGWICKYNLIDGKWKCIADIPSSMVKKELDKLMK